MIGILGGTFDPIHFGHLRPALEIVQQLGLRELRLIPSRVPPHRPSPQAPARHRLAMVERAIAGVPGFRVDTRELERRGPSFTVDTLRDLRRELRPECALLLLMGMDAFLGLHRWDRWEEIPTLAHLVVAHRPGSTPPVGAPPLAVAPITDSVSALRVRPWGRTFFQPVTQLDIAATRIRDDLRLGRSPRFLLPDSVLQYIDEQGLYRQNPAPHDPDDRPGETDQDATHAE